MGSRQKLTPEAVRFIVVVNMLTLSFIVKFALFSLIRVDVLLPIFDDA